MHLHGCTHTVGGSCGPATGFCEQWETHRYLRGEPYCHSVPLRDGYNTCKAQVRYERELVCGARNLFEGRLRLELGESRLVHLVKVSASQWQTLGGANIR